MGNYTDMFNLRASVGYSPWGMNGHGHGHVPRYGANHYTVNPNAAIHPDQIPSALERKYGILSNFHNAATHHGQYGHGRHGYDGYGHGGHGHYDEYGHGYQGYSGIPGAMNYTNLPPQAMRIPPQGGIYPPNAAGMLRQPMNGPPPGVNPGGEMDLGMPPEISENRGRSRGRPGDESHLPPSERSDYVPFSAYMTDDKPPTPEAETPAAKVSTPPFRP